MSKQRLSEVGSLFMIGLPDKYLDNSTKKLVKEGRIHNFILFKRNVESKKQLRDLCTSLTEICLENNLPEPLISIDQEGGSVTRLPPPFTQFPHQRTIASSSNHKENLRVYAQTCAKELKEAGINMNLAPVLDVCPLGQGFFMEKRCLGDDPYLVAKLGTMIIKEMQNASIATCAKHFPGLGKAVIDPHFDLPVVTTDRNEMVATDFVPFKAASAAGVAAFMTSHTIYENLDSEKPASLSSITLTDILRNVIGFEGLVITDDLEMGAIEDNDSVENAAFNAFVAGSDLLLICHTHDKVKKSLNRMLKAQENGLLDREVLTRALERQQVVRKNFV